MPGKNIKVPGGLHRQARFFAATRGLWQWLGQVETAAVREEMEERAVDRPIFSVQFHPEFDREIMRRYVEARRAVLAAEGFDDDDKIVVRLEASGMKKGDFDLEGVEVIAPAVALGGLGARLAAAAGVLPFGLRRQAHAVVVAVRLRRDPA